MNDPRENSGLTVAKGKVYPSPEAALADIAPGATVLIGGFAGLGRPEGLLRALVSNGVDGLTCICQGAWPQSPEIMDVAELVANGQVRKLIAPLGFYSGSGGPVEAFGSPGSWMLKRSHRVSWPNGCGPGERVWPASSYPPPRATASWKARRSEGSGSKISFSKAPLGLISPCCGPKKPTPLVI